MNFENAYENYKNGTATEEERAFVESEIAKARKLNAIIDEIDSGRVIEPAQSVDVKRAKRELVNKFTIRVAAIAVAVVLLLSVIAAASVFGYTSVTASGKAEFTKDECIELAKAAVAKQSGSSENIRVGEIERDLRFEHGKLSSAIYVYEIEVRKGYLEYEVVVDSAKGVAIIVDIGD